MKLALKKINAISYQIHVGYNVANEISTLLKKMASNHSSVFILVDENSEKYCLPKINIKSYVVIKIASGETNKNLDTCRQIWQTLLDNKADRNSLLINIGGGVVTDIGGFCASVYKRGIKFINVPTTLLAQVDASVGGKTGIDFNEYKNEIGTFSVPVAVFIDTKFTETLPMREIVSAYSEIIKHGLINDKEYFKNLADNFFGNKNNLVINSLVQKSIVIKNKIVQSDFSEKSHRKLLNFGHTIGHAIESFYLHSPKPLLHGEAIAIGMIAESYLSYKKKYISKDELEFIVNVIDHLFHYLKIDKFDEDTLIRLMQNDKKNSGGKINFTLLKKIGSGIINQSADKKLIAESLNYYLSTRL
jgi:3-dehydroquinate synthase